MDESSIHLPVINVWNKQMEKIKLFIKQNINLEFDDLEGKFLVLQKEMTDEIKGILFANYKNLDLTHQKECPKMNRLVSENKLLLNQLKEIGKELIIKSEQIQEKNAMIDTCQKEIRKLELERTVNRIQENMDKDQNLELVTRLENQVFTLNQKLNIIKDAINN
ncbi:uncharacterized protein cubi_00786 [Cryptosporidium ubiquitum]|uniref:Uncharacterized protein n=1 Tax=Cryptosporidium ubiquitum TaxID=857276 RepID=A0A1J4MB08_9CRYT|nr:uncharacterized protein cubi_00786 [Cryptosporidium ubiquitum]OII71408.1 hypothetical protein cubi_00786 [Cryptosporidium ubiquitum]